MSFAEIKKSVNSNLNTPINHLIWLNDYKTYGTNSYVYENKNMLHELYEDLQLSLNDKTISSEALNYLFANGLQEKDILKNMYLAEEFKNYNSVADILKNKEAAKSFLENETLYTVLSNNVTIMGNIFKEENIDLLNYMYDNYEYYGNFKLFCKKLSIENLSNLVNNILSKLSFYGKGTCGSTTTLYNNRAFIISFTTVAQANGGGSNFSISTLSGNYSSSTMNHVGTNGIKTSIFDFASSVYFSMYGSTPGITILYLKLA